MNDIELLKDAFRNSGLLEKPKHWFYQDEFGGECHFSCPVCRDEKARNKVKISDWIYAEVRRKINGRN